VNTRDRQKIIFIPFDYPPIVGYPSGINPILVDPIRPVAGINGVFYESFNVFRVVYAPVR
jgi:hypothetical protein